MLKLAVEHLMKKYERGGSSYKDTCEQFKTIRQDLIVQRISNHFAALVYEINARLAIQNSDLGEFNTCQTQIIKLHSFLERKEGKVPPHSMEFLAYRILYFLLNDIKQNVTEILCGMNEEKSKKKKTTKKTKKKKFTYF